MKKNINFVFLNISGLKRDIQNPTSKPDSAFFRLWKWSLLIQKKIFLSLPQLLIEGWKLPKIAKKQFFLVFVKYLQFEKRYSKSDFKTGFGFFQTLKMVFVNLEKKFSLMATIIDWRRKITKNWWKTYVQFLSNISDWRRDNQNPTSSLVSSFFRLWKWYFSFKTRQWRVSFSHYFFI